jgi:hypothetical protein
MRADKTTRLECQAGQVDLAITRCDARSEKSFAAEPSDVLSLRSNWKISMGLLLRLPSPVSPVSPVSPTTMGHADRDDRPGQPG